MSRNLYAAFRLLYIKKNESITLNEDKRTSRHNIVNTDNEEGGWENLESEGVIGSLTRVLQSGSASHMSMKNKLLD